MTETNSPVPDPPKGGLSPDFNLAEQMAANQPADEFEMPIAVQKANELIDAHNTDAKTNLLNQQAWLENFRQSIETLGPEDSAIVFVSDLNGFKAVNDKLGHDAGDELLGIVGQAYMQTFARSTDVAAHGSRQDKNDSIARLGGDEFAVFVTKKAGDSTKRVASNAEEMEQQPQRINQELSRLLQGTKFEKFNISLSVGAAEHQTGDSAEAMFAKADLEMFKAKYKGKIDQLTPEDRDQLERIVPFLDKIGHRVDEWARQAIDPIKPAA